ncbi:MAG TPA: hypothetical protein VF132_02740, partial [Rudaea sp.]
MQRVQTFARRSRGCLLAVCLLLIGIEPCAAVKLAYTVGADGQCDFHNLNSAIVALKQNPNPNRIFVAVSTAAPTASIAIDNVDLTIQGGFANCSDFNAPSARTTIDGSGNGGHSVFAITGSSNVVLENLTISNAAAGSDDGGGIHFNGSGSLTLSATSVQLNHAHNGAGIEMDAAGGSASLILGSGVFVSGNRASGDGGGIRLTGPSVLSMTEDGSQIANNHADSGGGGGLMIVGPAAGYVGSPGVGSAAAISGNWANDGGGVAVVAGDGSALNGYLYLFATDSTRPGRISGNQAFSNGGGVYLNSHSPTFGDDGYGVLCAYGFRIDMNAASEGTAIYTDFDSSIGGDAPGLAFLSNDKASPNPTCPSSTFDTYGAKQCTAAGCNLIDANEALDVGNDNVPTDGATLYTRDDGGYTSLYLVGVKLHDNIGGYLAHGTGSMDVFATLSSSNHLAHELLRFENAGFAHISSSTLADDEIDSQYVIHSEQYIYLHGSIIAEAGTKTLEYTGDSDQEDVADLVTNDVSTLPAVS